MSEISQSVTELIDQLGRLPGIGRKTAERLAYHLLRVHSSEAFALSDAIRRVRENVRYCSACFNLAEGELCGICMDSRRDTSLLCIVEQPRDLIAIEQSGVFKGLYHVLLGRIAPLEGVGPDQLTIDALVERVRNGNFAEVIMATNPNVEGDDTALFISNQLEEFPIELTRLARGVTSGSVLEFTNKEILRRRAERPAETLGIGENLDMNPLSNQAVIDATKRWLETMVIGLNLCPFAKAVHVKNRIRYRVSSATDEGALLHDLESELSLLHEAAPETVETTLLIHPQTLGDFMEFNRFLADCDEALARLELEGTIQIASFHPQYQFAGTKVNDVTNYTNRSPYPTLHLLREDSITQAVDSFPDVDGIYKNNIAALRKLGTTKILALLAGIE